MISLAWKKRAIPLYWKILTHKGARNLTEQMVDKSKLAIATSQTQNPILY
ncbi:MAG: hypothetical protein O4859_03460 [Trichodesmium sp. St18_bin1]|nr:hypothetical protein [Trichodesmium sp. St18_bin1]MDE5110562.1 hypothetical protein [Trichodesmium sp. St7_bin2_1]